MKACILWSLVYICPSIIKKMHKIQLKLLPVEKRVFVFWGRGVDAFYHKNKLRFWHFSSGDLDMSFWYWLFLFAWTILWFYHACIVVFIVAVQEQRAASATAVGSTVGDSSPPDIVLPKDKAEPLGINIQQILVEDGIGGLDVNSGQHWSECWTSVHSKLIWLLSPALGWSTMYCGIG